MRIGLIFPGQGVQAKNMGMDILKAYPDKQSLLNEISNITKIDVQKIITHSSIDELTDPYISSIIVFSISAMILEILNENGVLPHACAGYSIGQYAALLSCKSLELSELVKLVAVRGKLLKKYGSKSDSGMIGTVGLLEQQINPILNKVGESYIANYSTPTNLSISYKLSIKTKLYEEIEKLNPLKIIDLPVKGGWHSKFMSDAGNEFKPYLEKVTINKPDCGFYDNYTGALNENTNMIKENLYFHVFHPVKWYQIIKNMSQDGVDTFIEVGYGNQLSKFLMLINRRAKILNTSNLSSLKETINFFHNN